MSARRLNALLSFLLKFRPICGSWVAFALLTLPPQVSAEEAASSTRIVLLRGGTRTELRVPTCPSQEVSATAPPPSLEGRLRFGASFPDDGHPAPGLSAGPRGTVRPDRVFDNPASPTSHAPNSDFRAPETAAPGVRLPRDALLLEKAGSTIQAEPNPLRLRQLGSDLGRPATSSPSANPVAPLPPVAVGRSDQPAASEVSVDHEGDAPTSAVGPDPTAVELAPSPVDAAVAAANRAPWDGEIAHSKLKAELTASRISQAIATLIAGAIGAAAFVTALVAVGRRQGSLGRHPVIRVEIPNFPFPTYWVPETRATGESGLSGPAEVDRPTAVIDFGSQVIPFRLDDLAAQRRAEAEQEEGREERILKEVFEQNVALRQQMSQLASGTWRCVGGLPTGPAPASQSC